MINFQQSVNIREILLCSTLSERAVKIEFKQQQGSHLQRLLRLLQILQTGCKVEVKPQSLIYIPGIITNRDGEPIKFDCGDRSISYFLEIILILSLYAKAELNLELEGVTNDSIDCSVDTIINALIPLIKRFAPDWVCQVKVTRRGYGGKGLVIIKSQPIKYLKSVEQLERGPIKRIRGVCSGSKIAPNLLNRLVSQARNVFNDYIPDVWIHTDIQKSVKGIDFESGYGVSLVAETVDGVFISTDSEYSPDGAKDPESVGEKAALQLLDEIQYSGCVDTSLQQYAFILMALSEKKLNQFNIGRISIQTVETLRIIKQMLGVTFAIEGNIFSCLGTGLQNLSRMTQ